MNHCSRCDCLVSVTDGYDWDDASDMCYTCLSESYIKALALLRSIRRKLQDAPELNMSEFHDVLNASEKEAVALNDAVCDVCCEIDNARLDVCEHGLNYVMCAKCAEKMK